MSEQIVPIHTIALSALDAYIRCNVLRQDHTDAVCPYSIGSAAEKQWDVELERFVMFDRMLAGEPSTWPRRSTMSSPAMTDDGGRQ